MQKKADSQKNTPRHSKVKDLEQLIATENGFLVTNKVFNEIEGLNDTKNNPSVLGVRPNTAANH